ncbi:hypothetical protein [Streptomyces sp. HPF1205]|uniref:hypothetical protein n=1 Tax=Streptomyces sp. HPF1205 TaxID=2873262 RepID=UPI001CED1F19|nr:hypothetical protein [Streptomyces sp. HPF1205]
MGSDQGAGGGLRSVAAGGGVLPVGLEEPQDLAGRDALRQRQRQRPGRPPFLRATQ